MLSQDGTYFHEKVLIEILTLRVLLAFLLNSASFIQVDTLNKQMSIIALLESPEQSLNESLTGCASPRQKTYHSSLMLIFVLNNKTTNAENNTL